LLEKKHLGPHLEQRQFKSLFNVEKSDVFQKMH